MSRRASVAWRARLPLIGLALASSPAWADPSFTCQAKGDTWHVTGSSTAKMACQFTCALDGGGDAVDHVTCSATVYPGMPTTVPCQGFLLGKRWTAAELVAEQCSEAP